MSAPESFDEAVANLIASFQRMAANGLDWSEATTLAKDFTAAVMEFAELEELPGASKKAIVLAAVRRLLALIMPAINFPGLPWYVRVALPWILPILQMALMAVAEAWLQKTYVETYAPGKE